MCRVDVHRVVIYGFIWADLGSLVGVGSRECAAVLGTPLQIAPLAKPDLLENFSTIALGLRYQRFEIGWHGN